MSHAKQSAAEEGGSDDRAKSGAIPPRRGDSRVQFGIQLGTVSRPGSLLHSERSSRNELAQKPLSENCHLGREGALRTLASGYVAHLQSLVETVLKDATHVAPSVRGARSFDHATAGIACMPCLALITLLMTVQIEWGTFSSHYSRRKYCIRLSSLCCT